MTLLELIVKNGRKWALISKFLPGRNEHTVKNRYISILRFLKKKDKKVNPNNFQEVFDAFKQVKLEISSPTRGKKPIIKCRNPLLLQVPNEVDEFMMELSTKKDEVLDVQKKEEIFLENSLPSPNLTDILELSPRSSVFNFNSKEIPKPIFTVSKFQNPTPIQKGFGVEEDYLATTNNNSFNRNGRNINCSFDIESISQKLSSLTFNDHMDHILGDNRNMADQSDNYNMINLFSNPNYSHERSNILANGHSMSIEKSIQYLRAKNDPMYDTITENSGKSQILMPQVYEQNVMYDFEWDSEVNPERGGSRCKTHKINAQEIQERLNPMMNALRKRKSQTFCAPNESFIH